MKNKKKIIFISAIIITLIITAITITMIIINNSQYNYKKPNEYDEHNLYIGAAINNQNYGKKVDYVSKFENEKEIEIGWRLFYQDKNYAYLIADDVLGNYLLSDYISKYDNIDTMGEVGRSLNSDMFLYNIGNGLSWNKAMRATAFLTDTNKWKALLDEEGKAFFAIASPTIELYANSYRLGVYKDDHFLDYEYLDYEFDIEGYKISNSIKQEDEHDNGIYLKGDFWIASPSALKNNLYVVKSGELTIDEIKEDGNSYPIRPIVCLPTSKLTSKMILDDTQIIEKLINNFIECINDNNLKKIKNSINSASYMAIMDLEKNKIQWDRLNNIQKAINWKSESLNKELESDEQELLNIHFSEYSDKKFEINNISKLKSVTNYKDIYQCSVTMNNNDRYVFLIAKINGNYKIIGFELEYNSQALYVNVD